MTNKTPFSSKKFIAFLFSMVIITGVLVTTLFTQISGWALAGFMSIGIISLGALAIGYILGIASLEKFLDTVKNIVPKQKE
jgi:hypothetical protein